MNYEQEFHIFSSNVNQSARSFYYHKELQRQIYEDGQKQESIPNGIFQDSKIYQAVNANAQFWNDYKYSSIVYAVITLGRIFDCNKKSHGIKRLIKQARISRLFTKEQLRARKISGSENAREWIDDYMTNISELGRSDYYLFLRYVAQTRKLWDTVKEVRNKIYAHQDVMDDHKKASIFEKSTYDTFEEIIKRLLTVESIFFEAFHNGKKPDFDYQDKRVHDTVKKDVQSLLQRLITPINS